MKSKQQKQADLEVLTERFSNATSALVLSFSGLTVEKDQEFRNELRETGATYGVVKNTLARIAVKGTPFEEATESFKGVTSVVWSNNEPVDLSKVVSKYVKENKTVFSFKTGVVDGAVLDFADIEKIASLPSKEELIGKLLYLLNAPAQRLATVLSAIPRDLALSLQQVADGQGTGPAPAEAKEDTDSGDADSKEEAPEEKSDESSEEDGADEAASDESE